MTSELAKRGKTVTGTVVGVPKFNVGDFVVFTQDFLTRDMGDGRQRDVIAPAGTKGWVKSVEPPGFGDEVGVDIAGSGDRRFCDPAIIEPFEPDDFDRAWLSHDYETARRVYCEAVGKEG